MSNFLLKDPEAVFIHIPKTAGTSVRRGIWKDNHEDPVFGNIPKEWEDKFAFSLVRNPFDRLISAWFMFCKESKIDLGEFLDIVVDDSIIYDERRETFEERIRHHTIPQTHPFNCLYESDFWGRYETLDKDWETICKAVKMTPITLPILRSSSRNMPYWVHFSKENRDRAQTYYEEDLRLLSYAF